MNNSNRIAIGLLAFIAIILVGFFAEGLIGGYLNWPGTGSIFAIATLGFFMISSDQQK
ncbi:MAG: hypothetical protein HFE77_05270 [Clostridiales bacterium]|nr:hypothetical protein [Clostridiales bacterium]